MSCKTVGLVVLLLIVGSVHADCGDDMANLIRNNNCDFDSEMLLVNSANWTNVTGLPAIGDPNADSGLVQLAGAGGMATASNSCVDVSGTGNMVGFGGRVLVNVGSAALLSCTLRLSQFPMGSCAGMATQAEIMTMGLSAAMWTNLDGTTAFPMTTQSLQIELECTNNDAGSVDLAIDNFYVGEGITVPVELETFSVD